MSGGRQADTSENITLATPFAGGKSHFWQCIIVHHPLMEIRDARPSPRTGTFLHKEPPQCRNSIGDNLKIPGMYFK